MTRILHSLPVVLLMLGIAPTQAKDSAPNKILLGGHIGSATIISLSGVNSGEAIVRFQRKLDDMIEDCARSFGTDDNGDFDSGKIADCAAREMQPEASKIYTRRAVCPRNTLYTEFGNYSLIGWVKEPDQEVGGHTWRPVRTNWKDHRNGQIIDNCGGCNTPQLVDTYRILCPSWYKDAFGGHDPY